MRVQIRHSPAELIPTVDGVFSSYFITVKVEIKSCRYAMDRDGVTSYFVTKLCNILHFKQLINVTSYFTQKEPV